MKKTISTLMVATLSVTTVLTASAVSWKTQHELTVDDGAPAMRVKLSDLTEQHMHDFESGKYQSVIVECPAGTTLPFQWNVLGDLLRTSGESVDPIWLNRAIFVKFSQNDFSLSLDGNNWRPFTDFVHGNLSLNLGSQGLSLELVTKVSDY